MGRFMQYYRENAKYLERTYDFVERVNFKCGVEPSNIAVQRTGARDARPGR